MVDHLPGITDESGSLGSIGYNDGGETGSGVQIPNLTQLVTPVPAPGFGEIPTIKRIHEHLFQRYASNMTDASAPTLADLVNWLNTSLALRPPRPAYADIAYYDPEDWIATLETICARDDTALFLYARTRVTLSALHVNACIRGCSTPGAKGTCLATLDPLDTLTTSAYTQLRGDSAETALWIIQHRCEPCYQVVEYFVRRGFIRVLKLFTEFGYARWVCPSDLVIAVESGQHEAMRYLHSCGCPWNVVKTTAAAVRNNDLVALEFIYQTKGSEAVLTPANMREAVLRAHLTVVQFLYEHGCPWPHWDPVAFPDHPLTHALRMGGGGDKTDGENEYVHCAFVRYLCVHAFPFPENYMTYLLSSQSLLSAQCLHQTGCTFPANGMDMMCAQFAVNEPPPPALPSRKCLDMLEYMHAEGCVMENESRCFEYACRAKNISLLRSLVKIGRPLCAEYYSFAIGEGRTDVLEFLYAHQCPRPRDGGLQQCGEAIAANNASALAFLIDHHWECPSMVEFIRTHHYWPNR